MKNITKVTITYDDRNTLNIVDTYRGRPEDNGCCANCTSSVVIACSTIKILWDDIGLDVTIGEMDNCLCEDICTQLKIPCSECPNYDASIGGCGL